MTAVLDPLSDAARPLGQREHVVVVGGGIAGMGAALGLATRGRAVTLVESAAALGGACRSVAVDVPGRGPLRVDAGVSDFNRASFHRLAALLGDLKLPLQPVCQEASFRTPDGQWLWSSTPDGVAVAPGIDPAFSRDLVRFRAEAPRATDARQSVASWLRAHGYAADFLDLVVAPRALGCFPSPDADPGAIPMRALARFWGLHGIVGTGPADRVCVQGGMHRYLPALQARLQALGVALRLGDPVQRIDREPLVVHTRHASLAADRLVLAVEPDVALRLLSQPSADERRVLASCHMQHGRVVVHQDPRLMPSDPARWAAYNYVVPGQAHVPGPTITFFPQRLAHLPQTMPPVFVTLNPHLEPQQVIDERVLAHPVFGRDDAVSTQLGELQGRRSTWYCGAWTAEPFLHEQGLVSGLDVAEGIAAAHARHGRPVAA